MTLLSNEALGALLGGVILMLIIKSVFLVSGKPNWWQA
ncbi:MAG: hypothetical protein ACJAXQ_000688 [Parvibaculaceae bacterium]|jgi:hypothetical protein